MKVDSVKKSIVERLKAATPVDTGNARDHWRLNKQGQIVNEVDYIENLNAGSSQQAPRYFVEKTVAETPGVKPTGVVVKYI